VFLILSASLLSGSAAARGPIAVPDYDPARSFAPLVDAVAPAVVAVKTESLSPDDDGLTTRRSEGSGFIVSERGWVLTNAHVLRDITRLDIVLHDGRVVPASVLGSDADADIAVLKLEGDGPWPWLDLADSDAVRMGDRVLALGNPLGLGTSVTAGIVSAKGRVLDLDRWYRSDDFIQTDAAINQGNSGGPLFDIDGRVIGMNTAVIYGVNTIGFAIPSNLLETVVPDLAEDGRISRGFLGIHATGLSTDESSRTGIPSGAVVRRILPATPAAASGLRIGDVIVEVDGNAIDGGRDLIAAVGTRKPGEAVSIAVLRVRPGRSPARVGLQLTLAEKPTPESLPLGVELRPAPASIASKVGIEAGMLVTRIEPSSPAHGLLRIGDIVVSIDGRAVSSTSGAASAIASKSSDAVRFDVIRGTERLQIVVPRSP
jgi:serine protease Do